MSRTLAIIPARAGSKGVPGKNLRSLAGKPLVVHSIEQALEAPGIDDVVVTTDGPEIAAVARAAGAEAPFLRPPELSDDRAATEPAMRHALAQMEELHGRYETIVLLQPTSPLRLPGTLQRAIEQFHQTGVDSVVGVVESHAFFWKDGNPPTASYDYRDRPRRQDILPQDRSYRETGSIYVTRRDSFLAENNRLAGRIGLFVMNEKEGWEIDTLFDFALIETLLTEEAKA